MVAHYLKIIIVFIVFSVSTNVSHGASLDEKSIDLGLGQIAAGDYSEAAGTFDRVIASAPGRPEGYFFKASVFHLLKEHIQRKDYIETWRNNAEKALAICKDLLDSNPKDARALLLAGLTEGMRIVDALDNSSYLIAFLRAGSMEKYLEKAVELDSKLHDAYYGLGIYHVRGSTESWVRMFRFFIGDTSGKGRKYLRRAVEGGKWVSNSARMALFWALLRVEKFKQARKDIGFLRERFPKNVLYDIALAESYFIEKDYARARSEYVRLQSRLAKKESEILTLYRRFAQWRVDRCDYGLGKRKEMNEETEELFTTEHMYASLVEQIRYELQSVSETIR